VKIILRTLGAAFLTAGLLAVPSVAQAADDVPLLGALTERDAAGKSVMYPIHQGETVPVVLGVTNRGAVPAKGVVANIRVIDDLRLPQTFTNCRYYVDGNLHGAWCEFASDLPVGGTYALTPFQLTATTDAKKFSAVIFQWFPKDWVDENGGIEGFAKRDSGRGNAPVAGTGSALALEPRELPVPNETARVGFAYLKLVPPATPPAGGSPSATPTASPTATAPATTAPATTTPPATDTGGTGGGGLPVTGINAVAIAGVGGLLLAGGVIAFLLTRRRNRFTA